jgi:hypothetical protein
VIPPRVPFTIISWFRLAFVEEKIDKQVNVWM